MKGFCLSLLLDHFLSLSDLYLWAVATAFEKQGIVEMFGCQANGHLRTQKGFLTAWLSHHPSWDGSSPWNWETLPFVDCWCGAAWMEQWCSALLSFSQHLGIPQNIIANTKVYCLQKYKILNSTPIPVFFQSHLLL